MAQVSTEIEIDKLYGIMVWYKWKISKYKYLNSQTYVCRPVGTHMVLSIVIDIIIYYLLKNHISAKIVFFID